MEAWERRIVKWKWRDINICIMLFYKYMTKFNFSKWGKREEKGGRYSGFKDAKIMNQVFGCTVLILMKIVWLSYQVHAVALSRVGNQSLMAINDSLKRKIITVIIIQWRKEFVMKYCCNTIVNEKELRIRGYYGITRGGG